jgi:purine nucleosidase/pyrimidine-specific ribonucleoside hydrolase
VTQKVIIDTDIGDDIDDAYALAFALLRPELEVCGVTTVTGRADLKARLVAKILATLGRSEVPFAPGWTFPFHIPSEPWRRFLSEGAPNQYPAVREDEELPAPSHRNALDLLTEVSERYAGEVGLITLGPLTNVAAAFQFDPMLPTRLAWVASMGGEVAHHRLEYNLRADPVAADLVFRSGVRMLLATASVTERVTLAPDLVERLGKVDRPICRLLHRMTELWWPHRGEKAGPVLYDVVPVAWAFDPSLVRTERLCVQMQTAPGPAFGWTVVVSGGEPNMEVTTNVEEEQVRNLVLESLIGDGVEGA